MTPLVPLAQPLPGGLGLLDWRALFWSALLGLGFYLLANQPWQPFGKPRPNLRQELRRLNVNNIDLPRRPDEDEERAPLFGIPWLDALVGPFLTDLGAFARAGLGRFGIEGGRDLEARLALLDPDTPPEELVRRFWGKKMGMAFVPIVLMAFVRFAQAAPLDRLPVVVWLLCAGLGFAWPNLQLGDQLKARRRAIVLELPELIDQLALAVSAGHSPEQALRQLAAEGDGVLVREIAATVRDEAGSRRPLLAGLEEMAARNGVPELTALVGQLSLTDRRGGGDLITVLVTQSMMMTERKRLALLAEGKRARVKMLLPIIVCVLPVLAIVLLAPALLQVYALLR